MRRDIGEAALVAIMLFGWFTLGDLFFPELSLGKVAFILVPAVVAFAFWKLEKNQ
jgi:hypothetical protein